MNPSTRKKAQAAAIAAARAAGALMRRELRSSKKINEQSQHDIKLELDVRCQKLIQRKLHDVFPAFALLGEEGVAGDPAAPARWVVDPIDGTVNFTYGIPHACVSIALQEKGPRGYRTTVGVVYDPFLDEMWTAIRGQPARLNGTVIRVSRRKRLDEALVAIGFAKNTETMNRMLPLFNRLLPRVRKVRILGAAALSMVWIANGRLDAYREFGVRLWDIAAGGLIVECAGGEFWHRAVAGEHAYEILVNNGRLRKSIEALT